MKKITDNQITEAVAVLKNGGVVVFPTETSYGAAVDATNETAVKKLIQLKGRPANKSFPIIVASVAMAERFGYLRCVGRRLAKAYWPGALTLVSEVRPKSGLAKSLIHKNGTIALRVSSDPVALQLTKRLKAPITATSANISGNEDILDSKNLKLKADYILDCGRLKGDKPSTIASIVERKIDILRQGSVKPVDSKTC